MNGYIYFVFRGIRRSPRIKIGFSTDVEKRIAGLQTASPELLKLLGSVPGTIRQEKEIHAVLASESVGGEWYEPSHLVRSFVAYAVTFGINAAIAEAVAWSSKPKPPDKHFLPRSHLRRDHYA